MIGWHCTLIKCGKKQALSYILVATQQGSIIQAPVTQAQRPVGERLVTREKLVFPDWLASGCGRLPVRSLGEICHKELRCCTKKNSLQWLRSLAEFCSPLQFAWKRSCLQIFASYSQSGCKSNRKWRPFALKLKLRLLKHVDFGNAKLLLLKVPYIFLCRSKS